MQNDLSLNPFLRKQFIINNSTGAQSSMPSTYTGNSKCPTFNTNIASITYIGKNGEMNVIDIQKNISEKLSVFLQDSAIAKRCDTESRYVLSSTTKVITDPVTCCANSTILSNSNCTKFKNFYNTESYIYNPTPIDKRLTISDFVYKDQTLNPKSLCQQMNDISGLIHDFTSVVLKKIDEQLQDWSGNYVPLEKLQNDYNEMIQMRNTIDGQLQELLHKENTDLQQNKLRLDSTVYTTVLWTVLATSVLYYAFIKI